MTGREEGKADGLRLGGGVVGLGDSFEPVGLVLLRAHLDGEMGEGAFGGGPVPVVNPARDFHDVAWAQHAGGLAPSLIETLAANGDKELALAMAVPVVAATGLEGDIDDGDAVLGVARGEAREVRAASEVGGIGGVRFALREGREGLGAEWGHCEDSKEEGEAKGTHGFPYRPRGVSQAAIWGSARWML